MCNNNHITKCKICGTSIGESSSPILCPFQTSNTFGDNWNCGIINKIRIICDKFANIQCYIDQYFTILNTYDIENMGLCLFVSWYKRRGETEAMWILDEENIPRLPTYDDLVNIINYYENKEDKK